MYRARWLSQDKEVAVKKLLKIDKEVGHVHAFGRVSLDFTFDSKIPFVELVLILTALFWATFMKSNCSMHKIICRFRLCYRESINSS